MGSGFKDWAAGDVLTAADVDGYLMRQTVMTFADASARDTALSGVLDEGMVAYLEDVNALTVYNGSAWVAVIDSDVLTVDTANDRVGINDSTPSYALDVTGDINASGDVRIGGTAIGEYSDYTPTFSNISFSSYTARYAIVNKMLHVSFEGVLDSTVSANIGISAPVAYEYGNQIITPGLALAFDQNTNVVYYGVVRPRTSPTLQFVSTTDGNTFVANTWDANAPFTWASGDSIAFSVVMEAS